MKKIAGWALSAVILTSGFLAAQTKPAASLDQLKTLAGEWQGTNSSGKSVHVSYELASGGTAVLERLHSEDDSEMISVYSADGDRLAMTHYCSANNQPQMRTAAITGSPTKFTFSFVRATNLASPTAGHMHQLVLNLADATHLTQEWTWKENGQMKTEIFRFTRKS